jgi:hypothetical protein
MSDADKYCEVMEEIKTRVLIIVDFINENRTTGNDLTDVEFVSLQFRKILELIALGSIVSNKEKYSEIREKFESDWNAKNIIRDLSRINPEFYPRPVIKAESTDPSVDYHFEQIMSGYLSKTEFLKLYEKCGGLLHAENPFGGKKDYAGIKKNASDWVRKIQRLLDLHCVLAYGHEKVWIVQMREGPQQKVAVYTADGEISV